MGYVRTELDEGTSSETREVLSNLPVLYLSASRDPANDLAGRDSRLIVELLRSEAKRHGSPVALTGLRRHLGGLLSKVLEGEKLIESAETRVNQALQQITSGVSERTGHLITTDVDDALIARILEFSVSAFGDPRELGIRLETEGQGYANLLQLAVVLAAIPDLSHAHSDQDMPEDEWSEDQARIEMDESDDEATAEEDSLFDDQFHACIILEEPEAHLHPQLQHGLVRYLKAEVDRRPELQVILTTHSDEIVACAEPEDLVVFRRSGRAQPVARTVSAIGLKPEQLRQARRHLDVSRSSSLFAERVVLVEGITDATILRSFGGLWANGDPARARFLDALTITVVGSRVGEWLPALLTSKEHQIAVRVAVMMDSDGKPAPSWTKQRSGEAFRAFQSEPTLEPSIYAANPETSVEILKSLGFSTDDEPETGSNQDEIVEWLKKGGRRQKAAFAERVADALSSDPGAWTVPPHMVELLDYIYEGHHDPEFSAELDPGSEILEPVEDSF